MKNQITISPPAVATRAPDQATLLVHVSSGLQTLESPMTGVCRCQNEEELRHQAFDKLA